MNNNTISAEQIANGLGGKRTANGWQCQCPSHDDSNPSLSISSGTDGRPLVKCFAGCAQDAVIEALKSRGLWSQATKGPEKRTEYIYSDLNGQPELKVTRVDKAEGGKTFMQSHLENGNWVAGGFKGEVCPYSLNTWKDEKSRWIVLCEGEKVCGALAQNGFLATTTPGGANGWRSHYAKHFAGRNVAILPDNDKAGFQYSADAYRDIKEVAATVKVIELPGLREKGDAFDWFADGNSADNLKKLILETNSLSPRFQAVVDAGHADEKPEESLMAHVKGRIWPRQLAEEAFHGIAGKFVRLVEPTSESASVAILIQFLTAFGNIIGRTAHVQIGASKHYGNLFVALVGDSSVGRKGTAWDLVSLVMSKVDEKWWSECRVFGLGSGEGLVSAVKDYEIPTAEELKRRPNLKIEKPRDKRGMVIESEFGLTLKVFQREGGTLSPQVRNAWDSGDLRVTTKENSLKSTGAHISICAHITATELKQLLSMSDMWNGLSNRFMWICTNRSKLVPIPNLPEESRLQEITAVVKEAREFAERQGILAFDEASLRSYCSIYGDLAKERPGLLGVLAARAAPIIQRLSMIYALLDRSSVIRSEHLNAAVAVWDYAEQSIVAIFGDQTGDRNADKLLAVLLDAPGGLTQTEIVEVVFGRNLTKQKIAAALAILAKFDLVASSIEKSPDSNRKVIRWRSCSTRYEFNESNEVTGGQNSSNSYLVASCPHGGAYVS